MSLVSVHQYPYTTLTTQAFDVYSQKPDPPNDDWVMLHERGGSWKYDAQNKWLVHSGGKAIQPKGGHLLPSDNTVLVVHEARHETVKFEIVTPDRVLCSLKAQPPPQLSGAWQIVLAVTNPRATHTETLTVKTGMSQSTSSTTQSAWSVSATVAKGWFSASASYSESASQSSAQTWSTESERTRTITVEAGESVVRWQYVYTARHADGRVLQFRSSHFHDTNSIHVTPRDITGSFIAARSLTYYTS